MSGITTHCVEYALTPKSTCDACKNKITMNSLRCATMFRASKAVKKSAAQYTWYHFKCWTVPELVVKLPIEQFRGYPQLKDQDKKRVEKLVKAGLGANWSSISETGDTEEADTTSADADVDMTTRLTGFQSKSDIKGKKAQVTSGSSKEKNNNAKNGKTPAKTDNSQVKKTKEHKVKEGKVTKKTPKVVTPNIITAKLANKADQQELEDIAREIQESLQKNK